MSARDPVLGRRLITLLFGGLLFLAYALLAFPGQAWAGATISLSRSHGVVGDQVTAFGDGFGACQDPIKVTFDSSTVGSDTSGGDHFQVAFAVPPWATPGQHNVVASCSNVLAQRAGGVSPVVFPDASLRVVATFTVDDPEPETKADPVIVLNTTQGRPGDAFGITGTGYLCADRADVELWWDGGSALDTVAVDDEGRFSTAVEVPQDAEAGQHEVQAVCADDSAVQDSTVFTVLPADSGGGTGGNGSGGNGGGGNGSGGNGGGGNGGGGNGGGGNGGGGNGGGGNGGGLGDSGSGGLPVGLVAGPAFGMVVVVGAAAAYFYRHRAPHAAHARVTASLLPVAPADTDIRVTEPGSHSRPTRTIRLEPRADPGIQSVEEQ
ncbi:hypothetical protein AB0442_35920 [Kitasatospora sp. NPDC085895]|uniref:hypothetical protein n=1 Tax=Kitasatospora sp. NPDC085895 TaxID=3155057 RepID=UPI0034505669